MLNGLGPCILAGAIDMLYHHPMLAPLAPPLRVKYYGAFVYNGFILFVKVKKSSYEIRHFLPLEMFELIDVTEGECTKIGFRSVSEIDSERVLPCQASSHTLSDFPSWITISTWQ